MKKYENIIVLFKTTVLFFVIVSLAVSLLIIFVSETTNIVDKIVPVLTLLALDFIMLFVTVKCGFFTTYYSNDIVVQKLFFKTKKIVVSDIKTIVFTRNVFILLKETPIISDSKSSREIVSTFKKNIIITLGQNDELLVILSRCDNVNIILCKPFKDLQTKINRYFS
ncbi:MAG: hypothetical protein IJU60_05170 [Acholeplasmatales bacterium]|nr:hypothetical protein [Acholeplasmatales bacterium]